jgi:hypothetical protein
LILERIAAADMDALANGSGNTARKRDFRQTAVVITLGMVLGVALFVTGGYLTAGQRAAAPQPAVAQNDDELYTGSILYMPEEGRVCHQLLFQNLTGRFVDNGYVDCAAATYRIESGDPKQMSSARVNVIRTGFRDH